MNKLTALNDKAILKNIELVFKTQDSSKLNNSAYRFLMNVSGFIAHYDLYGFQCQYQNVNDLIEKLINTDLQWGIKHYSTYGIEQYGKDYGEAMARIYQGLSALLTKYQKQSKIALNDKIKNRWEFLKTIIEKGENDQNFKENVLRKFDLI